MVDKDVEKVRGETTLGTAPNGMSFAAARAYDKILSAVCGQDNGIAWGEIRAALIELDHAARGLGYDEAVAEVDPERHMDEMLEAAIARGEARG